MARAWPAAGQLMFVGLMGDVVLVGCAVGDVVLVEFNAMEVEPTVGCAWHAAKSEESTSKKHRARKRMMFFCMFFLFPGSIKSPWNSYSAIYSGLSRSKYNGKGKISL